MKRSGGTETSKYPEEKKSTEIPPVAAERTGAAREPESRVYVVEASGKARDEGRVTAPYAENAARASML